MDVDELVITLAFPNQERLQRGKTLPGTIMLDDKWNQGILDCVPSAFMEAFKSLVKGIDKAPLSSLARMFLFLPILNFLGVLFVYNELYAKCIQSSNLVEGASEGYLTPREVGSLCSSIPLVDNYGHVVERRTGVLVPASVSKWADLTVSNPWRDQSYVEFGEEYVYSYCYTPLTKEKAFLLLDWIRDWKYMGMSLPEKFLKCIKEGRSVLVDIPVGSVLHDSDWQIASQISDIPFIDQTYYGGEIDNFKEELQLLGVVVGFSRKVVTEHLKSRSYLKSLTAEAVVLMLECIHFADVSHKLVNALKRTNCLKTYIGFEIPSECFLLDPVWGCILNVFNDFPVIDHKFYGDKILTYKIELRKTGVVIDFEEAIKAFGHVFEQKASQASFNKHYTRVGDYRSSKKCILFGPDWESFSAITRLPFIGDSDNCYGKFPSDPSSITRESVFSLLECIRPPDKCLLFDSKWSSFLKPTDGPLIDETFYGPEIGLNSEELNAIGVIGDVKIGCSLMASHLYLHSESSTIVRIYRCLNKNDWKPENKATKRIWIPKAVDNGEWVSPEQRVNHDMGDLFGSRSMPSLDDYIEIWKEWESSGEQLSHDKCCNFWAYVLQHESKRTVKNIAESLTKLPITSGSDLILLLDKRDVFVADNLHLQNLFEQERVFVWYPESSLASLPRSELLDLYKKIGVSIISESVLKEESSLLDGVEVRQVDPSNIFIGKGLVKLVLSFLACSSIKIEAEKRHEAVQGLIELTVHETIEPVTVCYSLSLSSGKTITKKNVDNVLALSELIKLGFLVKFNEEAVDFLMESKDLQIFLEDEEFLRSAFPFV
ncbi:hypothetical protein glysoja_027019 [Glycine soja]|uniref:Sacsin n=1 Tax=Glycine soja TaxID=3848 RepID=A0A0B2Q773_GLYSO|nr:hypothetical protein glysoja_027019 [Glycine soja]